MRYFPIFLVAGLILWLAPAPIRAQQLQSDTSYHHFGQVRVGKSSSYPVHLTNTGKVEVVILSKAIRGSAFSLGDLTVPLHIKAGETVPVKLIFNPQAEGYTTGSLSLATTVENLEVRVNMSGKGVVETTTTPTDLVISPATITFGNVAVGATLRKIATLTAENGEVSISSDRSTSSEFSIIKPKLPVTIAAGSSVEVIIEFKPGSSGTATEKAGFISNAANSPTVAHVTGTGVATAAPTVDLTWEPGAGTAVGYNLYRGTAQAGPFSQINTALTSSTSFTDSTVIAGQTYYYVAAAVNSQGEESPYSNVAEATIP